MKKLIFCLIMIALTMPAYAAVIYVPADYTSIQEALNAATFEAEKTVELSPGIYNGVGRGRGIIWPRVSGVTLRGSGPDTCIISGESLDRVISVETSVSLSLESLTIAHGENVLAEPYGGGGMWLRPHVQLSLYRVDFRHNTGLGTGFGSGTGGAILAADNDWVNIKAKECNFSNNSAFSCAVSAYGSWEAEDCVFAENSAYGVAVIFGRAKMTGCQFINNSCPFDTITGSSGKWDIDRCVFYGNHATQSSGLFTRTAIKCANSLFYGNTVGNVIQGALFDLGTTCEVYNTTFYSNTSDAGSGAIARQASFKAQNCIFWDNTSAASTNCLFENMLTAPELTYCDIQENSYIAGRGNIKSDPLFISKTGTPDLHLGQGSPCIDTASATDAPDVDLDGNPRPIGGGYDMGCYEALNPNILRVIINGLPFQSGDVVSRNINMRVEMADEQGIATAELYVDDSTTQTALTQLPPISSFEGTWAAQFIIPPAQKNITTHKFRFHLVDGEGYVSNIVYNAIVPETGVQVIGTVYNYPNPFKPLSSDPGSNSTQIQYTLSADASVTLVIYDITGREVRKITSGSGQNGGRAGLNYVAWDGRSHFGEVSGNGMYLYKIISGGRVIGSGKLVILD